MPDKKLIDNEIKKVLECCIGDTEGKNCFDCPLYEIDDCQAHMYLDALDLINRLQTKVIKEQNKNSKLLNERNHLQAEAYKECIEKVKNYIKTHCNPYGKPDFDYNTSIKILNFIDNLKKELVGEEIHE